MTATAATKSKGARVLSPVERVRAHARILPITIEQYHEMIEKGIVPEDSTVELLRGMLVRKDRSVIGEDPMGHSPLHKAVLALLTKLAVRLDSDRHHLQIQLPVACPPDGAPEPDASIVRGTPRYYLDRLPGPGDVSCVIESAHSSLARDREDKLPIYGAAGIPQYIILNLQNNTLEVYTDPSSESQEYRTKNTVERDGSVSLNLPDGQLTIAARDILP